MKLQLLLSRERNNQPSPSTKRCNGGRRLVTRAPPPQRTQTPKKTLSWHCHRGAIQTCLRTQKRTLSPPPQHPLPPYIIPAHCYVPQLHQTSPHPAIAPPQHPPQTVPPYLPKQDPLHACGHHEHNIYGDHAFCCERGSKKRAHNVIAMDFAGALSLLFLHKPATFFLTHPWQSNHCSTSTQTRQHDRSTFHSLLIPPHSMPLLPIHHYWGRHQHHRPPAYPQPTNLTLKTL